jgi:hypothetical protein
MASSLSQRVRLELEDGSTVETTYDGRELRAWEKSTGKSALVESMSISMLTWLAWRSARRENKLNGEYATFDKFDAVCTGVQGIRAEQDDEDEERPTEAGDTRLTASDE